MTMEMFNQGMAMGKKAFEDMVVQNNKMIRDMLEDKETGGKAETSSCAWMQMAFEIETHIFNRALKHARDSNPDDNGPPYENSRFLSIYKNNITLLVTSVRDDDRLDKRKLEKARQQNASNFVDKYCQASMGRTHNHATGGSGSRKRPPDGSAKGGRRKRQKRKKRESGGSGDSSAPSTLMVGSGLQQRAQLDELSALDLGLDTSAGESARASASIGIGRTAASAAGTVSETAPRAPKGSAASVSGDAARPARPMLAATTIALEIENEEEDSRDCLPPSASLGSEAGTSAANASAAGAVSAPPPALRSLSLSLSAPAAAAAQTPTPTPRPAANMSAWSGTATGAGDTPVSRPSTARGGGGNDADSQLWAEAAERQKELDRQKQEDAARRAQAEKQRLEQEAAQAVARQQQEKEREEQERREAAQRKQEEEQNQVRFAVAWRSRMPAMVPLATALAVQPPTTALVSALPCRGADAQGGTVAWPRAFSRRAVFPSLAAFVLPWDSR
eukprot:g2229.t1